MMRKLLTFSVVILWLGSHPLGAALLPQVVIPTPKIHQLPNLTTPTNLPFLSSGQTSHLPLSIEDVFRAEMDVINLIDSQA